jgi:pimeloyl-ACP methyl ester carboxylesterase
VSNIALVLLPGLDGTGFLFNDFVAELPAHVEPIVVRYPTHQPLSYMRLEGIVRWSLPKARPFALLGESFSGPIAISIAASKPAGLVGLVLCCTFARYPRNFLRRLHSLAPYVPVAGPLVAAARRVVAPVAVEPSVASKLDTARGMVSKRVFRARVGELLRVDVTDRLAEIDVPILDLRARRDGVVPNRSAEAIRRLGRRVRGVDMNGPHFLLQAKPSETAAIVSGFVRESAE